MTVSPRSKGIRIARQDTAIYCRIFFFLWLKAGQARGTAKALIQTLSKGWSTVRLADRQIDRRLQAADQRSIELSATGQLPQGCSTARPLWLVLLLVLLEDRSIVLDRSEELRTSQSFV